MSQMQPTNGKPNRRTRRAAKAKKVPEAQTPAPEKQPEQVDLSKLTFEVPGTLLQATVNYLATRPYQETFQLIHALQQLQPTKKT